MAYSGLNGLSLVEMDRLSLGRIYKLIELMKNQQEKENKKVEAERQQVQTLADKTPK